MKYFSFSALCVALLLLAGCDKGGTPSTLGFEVENFSFQAEEDGLWGLMDTDGKVVVKPMFDGMPTNSINGMFSVYDSEENVYTLYRVGDVAKPTKIGVYHDMGAFTGRLCPVVDADGDISYIDREGKKVLDLQTLDGERVLSAFNFFDGRAMVMLESRKWGYIDEKGKAVVPCKYDDAWNFAEGLAIVYSGLPDEDENASWSVIDTEGNVLFTKQFRKLQPYAYRFTNGYLVVKDGNERTVILDRKGETVARLKTGRFAGNIYGDRFAVYNVEKEKSGLMDIKGELLMGERFDQLQYNGSLLVATVGNGHPYLYKANGERDVRLPEGDVTLFEAEYRGCDKRLLVGEYDEGFDLVDAKGKKVKTEKPIFAHGLVYNWGVSVPGAFEEVDGSGDDFVEEPALQGWDEDDEVEWVEVDSAAVAE